MNNNIQIINEINKLFNIKTYSRALNKHGFLDKLKILNEKDVNELKDIIILINNLEQDIQLLGIKLLKHRLFSLGYKACTINVESFNFNYNEIICNFLNVSDIDSFKRFKYNLCFYEISDKLI